MSDFNVTDRELVKVSKFADACFGFRLHYKVLIGIVIMARKGVKAIPPPQNSRLRVEMNRIALAYREVMDY